MSVYRRIADVAQRGREGRSLTHNGPSWSGRAMTAVRTKPPFLLRARMACLVDLPPPSTGKKYSGVDSYFPVLSGGCGLLLSVQARKLFAPNVFLVSQVNHERAVSGIDLLC